MPDNDVRVFMRFPGGRVKTVTLSYDDNVEADVKLVQIMKKYGLKGTFNINSGQCPPETRSEASGNGSCQNRQKLRRGGTDRDRRSLYGLQDRTAVRR